MNNCLCLLICKILSNQTEEKSISNQYLVLLLFAFKLVSIPYRYAYTKSGVLYDYSQVYHQPFIKNRC